MTSPICYVCDAPTIKTCQRCSTIYYCSKECQQSDRASHSEYCASIRGGEREIWGLESIREIAQNPVEELVMHRKLLQDAHASELSPKGLYKEEKDIVDFFKKSQGKNGLYVACMIFDLYSSEVLPSYNIILDMLGEAESMDHEAFIASVCIGREDKKRGDSHFICIRNGCCDYYACLVRCPYRGGTQQKYRVFQSYFPHYGLKEWMEDPSATDVDKYLTRIEEIVTQGGLLAILAALSVAKQWDAVLAFIVTFVAVRTAYHRFDRTFLDEEEDENGVLCVKKLEAYAKLPVRGSRYAAGFDICSTVDKEIPPNCMELVPTGLAIQTPKNYYGQLVVRSGTCWKHKMDVLAGVIDEDYRGHVQVVLRNTSMTNTFYVKRGEPFAQLILLRCGARIPCIEVNELEKSERGSGGFGSTDVNRKTN